MDEDDSVKRGGRESLSLPSYSREKREFASGGKLLTRFDDDTFAQGNQTTILLGAARERERESGLMTLQ